MDNTIQYKINSISNFEEDYFLSRNKAGNFSRKNLLSGFKYPFWNRIIKNLKGSGRLLDIGCAEGEVIHWAKRRNIDSYGIDISRYAIMQLNEYYPGIHHLALSSIEYLPFQPDQFDVITCFDVLEHLINPINGIREVHRCLVKGGLFIVSVPNVNSIGRELKGDKWFAYRDITHKSLLQREEWIQLIEQCDFSISHYFFDVLWDAPYPSSVPALLQTLHSRIHQLFFYAGFTKSRERYGENLYIIAQKIDVFTVGD